MTIIKGNATTRQVWINGIELNPSKSLEVISHSPDGFMWGYAGSGPAQLSLAILLEVTEKEEAIKHYSAFKNFVVLKLNMDLDFEIGFDFPRWFEDIKEKTEFTLAMYLENYL